MVGKTSVLNLNTVLFLSPNHHVNHFNSLPAQKSSPSLNFKVSHLREHQPMNFDQLKPTFLLSISRTPVNVF